MIKPTKFILGRFHDGTPVDARFDEERNIPRETDKGILLRKDWLNTDHPEQRFETKKEGQNHAHRIRALSLFGKHDSWLATFGLPRHQFIIQRFVLEFNSSIALLRLRWVAGLLGSMRNDA